MFSTYRRLVKKSKLATVAAVIAVGIGLAGTYALASNNQSVTASTCDKVNIIYCGLSGSSTSDYINSFQNYYGSNESGHSASPSVGKNYTDVQKVFNYFGATNDVVGGMNTTNTKVGYLYRDGKVIVDGKTVGTDGAVAARFSVPGATNIDGTNVYVRKTTSSFAQEKAEVIVYFKDGVMQFGVMVNCGNPINAKPVEQPPITPPVTPQDLKCTELTATPIADSKDTFTFKGKATPSGGATISSYQFVFGNGQTKMITSNSTEVSATHTYTNHGSYTVVLNVTGVVDGANKTVTSASCTKTITVEAPQQALACVGLKASPTTNKNEFTFVATANTINGATITGYEFSFGDNNKTTVTSTANTASTTHAYAGPGNYFATVTVAGVANGVPVTKTDPLCATQIAIEKPPVKECKPGIPEGDSRCTPCPYNPELPANSPDCKAPPQVLPATGPAGIVTLFGATTALGSIGHSVLTKRRLR